MPLSRIRFESHTQESTFLDPRNGFQPVKREFEVRVDPLTGRTGHFSHFGAIAAQKLPIDAYATPEIRGFCPFCLKDREKYTPRFTDTFLGEGRPTRNEAVLIPNLFPYDIYNGVVIMTDDHVVPLEGFDEKRLRDTLSLGIDFLKRIDDMDRSLPYHLMTWNYMPPSGGGLVHPHQQFFASKHPGNLYMDELKASEQFFKTYGANYWGEIAEEERSIGSRFIGRTGNADWLASFVSLGLLGEVACIFPNSFCIRDFGSSHMENLIEGILRVFKYYIASGIHSFNASLSFGPPNQGFFSTHFRIIPRTFLNMRDYASDLNFFQAILGEPVSVVMPEILCGEARKFFE